MAVPKRKTSKSRKRKRRQHQKLKVPGMSVCPNCGEIVRPHHACTYCGYYKGQQVINLDKETE